MAGDYDKNFKYFVDTGTGNGGGGALTETLKEARDISRKLGGTVISLRGSGLRSNPDVVIPRDIADKFKNAARTWVALQLKRGNDMVLNDTVQGDLEVYFQILELKLGRLLERPNIFDIESPSELTRIVRVAYPDYHKHLRAKSERSTKNQEGQRLLAEDECWRFYTPTTKGGAIALGKNTKWCTAAPGLNYYETYTKKAPLFILISKKHKDLKFQSWVTSSEHQYMNLFDREMDPYHWEIMNVFLEQTGNTDHIKKQKDTVVNIHESINMTKGHLPTWCSFPNIDAFALQYGLRVVASEDNRVLTRFFLYDKDHRVVFSGEVSQVFYTSSLFMTITWHQYVDLDGNTIHIHESSTSEHNRVDGLQSETMLIDHINRVYTTGTVKHSNEMYDIFNS